MAIDDDVTKSGKHTPKEDEWGMNVSALALLAQNSANQLAILTQSVPLEVAVSLISGVIGPLLVKSHCAACSTGLLKAIQHASLAQAHHYLEAQEALRAAAAEAAAKAPQGIATTMDSSPLPEGGKAH